MEKFLSDAKNAKKNLSNLNAGLINNILLEMADELELNSHYIEVQNKIDMDHGKINNLSNALMDRLFLDNKRIKNMADALREIAKLKNPIGRLLDGWVLENGLQVQKVSVPIGIIGIIYESRPNVTSDTAALCFKSGNVCILKGGKEAYNSNKAITETLQKVLEKNKLPKACISLLPDGSREAVKNLIKQDKYLDLIVPRGGESLIKFISTHSTIPVIKHDKGLCHIYIDSKFDQQKALDIIVNAKCQRPGVCNSLETLLIHENNAKKLLPQIQSILEKEKVQLLGCPITRDIINVNLADENDWYTEYLDLILSIKVVKNIDEAIEHINKYGSGHSDSILSEDYNSIEIFLNHVDSACVYANASTRFTDGGSFGFGAEVGISTSKLHARGPMGINELTTYKFKILGNGQIR